MYVRNISGPSTVPWGTPERTGSSPDDIGSSPWLGSAWEQPPAHAPWPGQKPNSETDHLHSRVNVERIITDM